MPADAHEILDDLVALFHDTNPAHFVPNLIELVHDIKDFDPPPPPPPAPPLDLGDLGDFFENLGEVLQTHVGPPAPGFDFGGLADLIDTHSAFLNSLLHGDGPIF